MNSGSATIIRVLLTALMVGLGFLGCLPAMFAPMMFAAPGATRNPATWLLALSVGTFPIACLAAVVLAWLQRLSAASLWWFALPLVNVALGLAALAWLHIVYGGAFNG